MTTDTIESLRAERDALAAQNEKLRKALGKAVAALGDMSCAFEWGTTASVSAGVGRCNAALKEASYALSPSTEHAAVNQCDGCRAGVPVSIGGIHCMSQKDGYQDLMACTAARYAPASKEEGT
jgi:hypothetical protein